MELSHSIVAGLTRAITDYFRASLDDDAGRATPHAALEIEEERRRRREAMLAEASAPAETPRPAPEQTFAEKVAVLASMIDDAHAHVARPEPASMVEVMYSDRQSGFVGRLFIDAATGREVKIVTPERTVWL